MSVMYANETLIPGLRDLWKKAFGDTDEFLDLFFGTAYAPDRCRCIAEDGKVRSVLYWFDCFLEDRKIAYIYAVATDPACRGRGLCREVMEDTMEVLRSRGYDGAILLPQEEWLIAMYAGMGFEPCTTVMEKWFPAGEEISARQIGAEEYAALRREFLPAGGVIQEGENIRFLTGMARFYTGDHFLAAVSADGEEMWCPEFLGDFSAVPGLIKMLGFPAGRARMPGKDRQFAMYRSLSKKGKNPRYFGLVFD